MKNILIIIFSTTLLLFKCDKQTPVKNGKHHSELANKKTTKAVKPKSNDTLTNKLNKENTSPIKIIKATLHKNQYSDHKDIRLIFKNAGKKNIRAIKFEWFCLNSFDKPASGRFFYGEGRFTENSVHLLKSNHSRTEFWEDFSTDADRIIKIRAYYIVFTDGTKWELNEDFSHSLLDGLEKNKF